MGNAFKVGLGERIVNQCYTNDAAELMLGDICAYCELGEGDGVVRRDKQENAEVR